jgi:hypothetical protein
MNKIEPGGIINDQVVAITLRQESLSKAFRQSCPHHARRAVIYPIIGKIEVKGDPTNALEKPILEIGFPKLVASTILDDPNNIYVFGGPIAHPISLDTE